MNYDLTVLMPESDKITLDDESGVTHEIKVKLPGIIGAFIFENKDKFAELAGGSGTDAEGIVFMTRLLSLILSNQYSFMDEAWVAKNISFDRMLFMVRIFGDHLTRKMNNLGSAETVQPIKEPESE